MWIPGWTAVATPGCCSYCLALGCSLPATVVATVTVVVHSKTIHWQHNVTVACRFLSEFQPVSIIGTFCAVEPVYKDHPLKKKNKKTQHPQSSHQGPTALNKSAVIKESCGNIPRNCSQGSCAEMTGRRFLLYCPLCLHGDLISQGTELNWIHKTGLESEVGLGQGFIYMGISGEGFRKKSGLNWGMVSVIVIRVTFYQGFHCTVHSDIVIRVTFYQGFHCTVHLMCI